MFVAMNQNLSSTKKVLPRYLLLFFSVFLIQTKSQTQPMVFWFMGHKIELLNQSFLTVLYINQNSLDNYFYYNYDTVQIKNTLTKGRVIALVNNKKCHLQYNYFFDLEEQIVDSMTVELFCDSKCLEKSINWLNPKSNYFYKTRWEQIEENTYLSKKPYKRYDKYGKLIPMNFNKYSFMKIKLEKIDYEKKCFRATYSYHYAPLKKIQ